MKMVTANGAAIPALGFGTYGMSRDLMLRTVPAALDAGFRHIDTAQIYRNEAEVGECVQASGLNRADVFLTTPDERNRLRDRHTNWLSSHPAGL